MLAYKTAVSTNTKFFLPKRLMTISLSGMSYKLARQDDRFFFYTIQQVSWIHVELTHNPPPPPPPPPSKTPVENIPPGTTVQSSSARKVWPERVLLLSQYDFTDLSKKKLKHSSARGIPLFVTKNISKYYFNSCFCKFASFSSSS